MKLSSDKHKLNNIIQFLENSGKESLDSIVNTFIKKAKKNKKRVMKELSKIEENNDLVNNSDFFENVYNTLKTKRKLDNSIASRLQNIGVCNLEYKKDVLIVKVKNFFTVSNEELKVLTKKEQKENLKKILKSFDDFGYEEIYYQDIENDMMVFVKMDEEEARKIIKQINQLNIMFLNLDFLDDKTTSKIDKILHI